MVVEYNNTGATVATGRKWDLTNCGNLSATTDSFALGSWPKGDHSSASDYSADGECTEASANCAAEIVATICNFGSGSHNIRFDYYDNYDRKIYTHIETGVAFATAWMGRFGERNTYLEIHKPGRYYCVITADGAFAKVHFDVYSQSNEKYLHLQGNDYGTGNSWAAAKSTWASAQTALTTGNNINVMDQDYSSQTGFTFSKSQNIIAHKSAWGGYFNITDSPNYGALSSLNTYMEITNPIECNGIIDRWAVNCSNSGSPQVKLKIYRGGHAGTANYTTSTIIYNGSFETVSTNGWNTYTLSPAVTVQRGDLLAVYCNTGSSIGFKSGVIGTCNFVSGDVGDAAFGANYLYGANQADGLMLMLRAWNSATQKVITLPKV